MSRLTEVMSLLYKMERDDTDALAEQRTEVEQATGEISATFTRMATRGSAVLNNMSDDEWLVLGGEDDA